METTQAMPTSAVSEKHQVSEDPNEVIILRAFRKTQLKVKCSPLPDRTGKHYTGQGKTGYFEDLSEDDKRSLPFVIKPSTVIVVDEGKSFAIGKDPQDFANWKWLQKHVYIALTKEAGLSSRDASYYVFNAVSEAEQSLTRTEKIDEALWALRSASEARKVKLANAFGFGDAASAPPSVVANWLRELVFDPKDSVKNATKIVGMLGGSEDSLRIQDAMTLFNQLKLYKIVEKYRGGMYRWSGENGIVLGADEDKCVQFLADPDNAETVNTLKLELQEKMIPSV